MAVLHLDGEEFVKTIKTSDKPVLVDFWAPWCGPCRMLAPILEEVEQDLGSKITVAKVNVDENQELAQQFQIMSIPAMMIFKGGKAVDSMVGLMPKDRIVAYLNKHI